MKINVTKRDSLPKLPFRSIATKLHNITCILWKFALWCFSLKQNIKNMILRERGKYNLTAFLITNIQNYVTEVLMKIEK